MIWIAPCCTVTAVDRQFLPYRPRSRATVKRLGEATPRTVNGLRHAKCLPAPYFKVAVNDGRPTHAIFCAIKKPASDRRFPPYRPSARTRAAKQIIRGGTRTMSGFLYTGTASAMPKQTPYAIPAAHWEAGCVTSRPKSICHKTVYFSLPRL